MNVTQSASVIFARRFMVIAGLFVAIFATLIMANYLNGRQPVTAVELNEFPNHPTYKVAKYLKPDGCELVYYQRGGSISNSCNVPAYRIKEGDYGLLSTRRDLWVRVGNSAYDIICGFPFSKECSVVGAKYRIYAE